MKKMLNSQSGFTLVELMVVVAIIGVLSAIAVPNFKKYQAKSKTSEAKLQLSAAYTAQQSFFSDYDSYAPCLQYMGYNPSNEAAQRIYAVGFGTGSSSTVVQADLLANGVDSTACPATTLATCTPSGTACTLYSAAKKLGSTAALTTFAAADAGTTLVTETTFLMGAVGIIDKNYATATTASAFNITENKKLTQYRAGY